MSKSSQCQRRSDAGSPCLFDENVIPASPNTKNKKKKSLVNSKSSTISKRGIDLGWKIQFSQEESQTSGYESLPIQARDTEDTVQNKTPPPKTSPANKQISTPTFNTTPGRALPTIPASPVEHLQTVNELKARIAQMEEKISKLEEGKKVKEKTKVREQIRNYVRVCCKNICNDPTNGLDWDFNIGVFDGSNSVTTSKIKENVKALDNTVTEDEFKGAVKTYFSSSKYYHAKRTTAFLDDAAKKGRKRAKLKARKEALEKSTTISDVDKMVIETALTLDFMSSEDEKEEADGFQHFEQRPLRWRSRQCDKYFEALDKRTLKRRSPKARKQTVVRKMGPFSGRGAPKITDTNSWAIRTQ